MANIGPCFLALIINCLGFHMFFTPVHYPTSPFVSSIIFSWAVYFFVLQFNLYPRNFRRLPWVCTRLYEFVASVFILEFSSSNIWFPMETFTFVALGNMAGFLKRSVTPRNWLFPLSSPMCICLQNYTTGIVLSYTLSFSALMIILHGTYTIDLRIVRRYGIFIFLREVAEQAKGCIMNLFRYDYGWYESRASVRPSYRRTRKAKSSYSR